MCPQWNVHGTRRSSSSAFSHNQRGSVAIAHHRLKWGTIDKRLPSMTAGNGCVALTLFRDCENISRTDWVSCNFERGGRAAACANTSGYFCTSRVHVDVRPGNKRSAHCTMDRFRSVTFSISAERVSSNHASSCRTLAL